MKKLIFISLTLLLTLSSFTTVNNFEQVRLVRWNYSCNDGTGHTGSFLAPSGTTHEEGLAIARSLCQSRRQQEISQ